MFYWQKYKYISSLNHSLGRRHISASLSPQFFHSTIINHRQLVLTHNRTTNFHSFIFSSRITGLHWIYTKNTILSHHSLTYIIELLCCLSNQLYLWMIQDLPTSQPPLHTDDRHDVAFHHVQTKIFSNTAALDDVKIEKTWLRCLKASMRETVGRTRYGVEIYAPCRMCRKHRSQYSIKLLWAIKENSANARAPFAEKLQICNDTRCECKQGLMQRHFHILFV